MCGAGQETELSAQPLSAPIKNKKKGAPLHLFNMPLVFVMRARAAGRVEKLVASHTSLYMQYNI